MELDEIVLPETKPETEWVRGRALQKMSPMRDHSLIQGELILRLGHAALPDFSLNLREFFASALDNTC